MKKLFVIGMLMTMATSAHAGNGQVGSTDVTAVSDSAIECHNIGCVEMEEELPVEQKKYEKAKKAVFAQVDAQYKAALDENRGRLQWWDEFQKDEAANRKQLISDLNHLIKTEEATMNDRCDVQSKFYGLESDRESALVGCLESSMNFTITQLNRAVKNAF